MRALMMLLLTLALAGCASAPGLSRGYLPPESGADPEGMPQFAGACGTYAANPSVFVESFLQTSPGVALEVGIPTSLERIDAPNPREAREVARTGHGVYHHDVKGARGSANVEVTIDLRNGEWFVTSWKANDRLHDYGPAGCRISTDAEALALDSAATLSCFVSEVGKIDSISILASGDGSLAPGAPVHSLVMERRSEPRPADDYRVFYLMIQSPGHRLVGWVRLVRAEAGWTLDSWLARPPVPENLRTEVPESKPATP